MEHFDDFLIDFDSIHSTKKIIALLHRPLDSLIKHHLTTWKKKIKKNAMLLEMRCNNQRGSGCQSMVDPHSSERHWLIAWLRRGRKKNWTKKEGTIMNENIRMRMKLIFEYSPPLW